MGPDPGGGGGGPTLISQANAIAATLPAAPRIRPATPAPISAASEKRRRSRPGSATTAGGARRVRELAQGRSRRCSRRRSYGSSGRRVCSVIATVMAVLEVDLKNLGARAVY
ncbi:hypothetical protein I547_7363 [Mycobacterium kansasii 824]|nr:hypothetical protein I547_7363 [Mycobacterium kansasii 824]